MPMAGLCNRRSHNAQFPHKALSCLVSTVREATHAYSDHYRSHRRWRPALAGQFFKRVQDILNQESVSCTDPKILAKLIEKHFPDYRRILNELQRYSVSGSIDEGILVNLADVNTKELTDALKDKDWKKMRQWVVNNIDNDPATIYRKLYDQLTDQVETIPQLILLLAYYQYKAAFVADAEVNLVACLTEIMAAVKFK
jgi:hypothetical protein